MDRVGEIAGWMGSNQSVGHVKVNYEDVQMAMKYPREGYLLINTLPSGEQHCLIATTVSIEEEEALINDCLSKNLREIHIIVYGKNSNDETVQRKYEQLTSLGFHDVHVYSGGMFEWLMLQEIYGESEFQTTRRELDILKYKPGKTFHRYLLER